MFDAHLHLPIPPDLPSSWGALLATSDCNEWAQIAQIQATSGVRRMLGFLPQHWSSAYSVDSLCETLASYLEADASLAVGEIGLDKRFHTTLALWEQERLCSALLSVAQEYQRPVALHVVHSHGAMLTLLRKEKPQIPLLWHGFLGSLETARVAVQLGCTLSIGLAIWRDGNRLQRELPHLPTPYLLESDYPFHYQQASVEDLGYWELLRQHYQLFAQAIGTEQAALEHYCDTQSKIFTN